MLPEGVRLDRGSGDLERLVIETQVAEAHVYLYGAQVTHFQPRDGARPVLFVSRKSAFVPGKAIRGGVPISFPWFAAKAGDPSAPSHGFARLLPWELVEVTRDEQGRIRARLRLGASDTSRRWVAHELVVEYAVTVGAELGLELSVRNAGGGATRFEQALHTYFAVGDARALVIRGLEDRPYVDKTRGFAQEPPAGAPLALEGETDRIYLHVQGRVTIDDATWARRLRVDSSGSLNTVVWNPWSAKAKGMADLGEDEWTKMVCVETANVGDDAILLESGGAHVLRATIGVERGGSY